MTQFLVTPSNWDFIFAYLWRISQFLSFPQSTRSQPSLLPLSRSIEQWLRLFAVLLWSNRRLSFVHCCFPTSHGSISRTHVCGQVQTCEINLKGQTGSKPPLEVVWLDANGICIVLECAFSVDALVRIKWIWMRIKWIWMRIQCGFVGNCGQALRQGIVVLWTRGQSMLSIVRIYHSMMRRGYPFQPKCFVKRKQKLMKAVSEEARRKYAHSYV